MCGEAQFDSFVTTELPILTPLCNPDYSFCPVFEKEDRFIKRNG